ncbi:GntR family transcriptional regulator [Sinorhizobium psoraleae]|uniref:GntR family transcriptional regulator n=1 Tax=Sinorhizobium psoraleae TaxID=520838 RepID=A0ABT4KHH4_9HYPH|nr:GntR family transcriptional regulator [Sinorhizobium psoraleae]MCZ4091364.1 GntR family transcriptional regulator [Sinorhizobium psoraleae]
MQRVPGATKSADKSDRSGVARKRAGRADERIHSEIYAAIINHQIRPATPLQEDALATAFGVSRTIIRKVLQRLAHEKLVDLIPNKGAFVARPSIEEARQVFEARRGVECILIEKLAATIGDAGIGRLTDLLDAEAEALTRNDKKRRLQLSGDFHLELAALAGNAVLRDFVQELVSRTSLIIALYESPGAVPCSQSEHRDIIEALKQRDAKAAVRAMEHHLRHIEAQIDLADQPSRVDFAALFKPVA